MTKRVKVVGDLFHGVVPDGAVYVGRAAPGLKRSRFANPFKVTDHGLDEGLRLYRDHVKDMDVSELRGRDLACWCPLDRPCHADILLEMANP